MTAQTQPTARDSTGVDLSAPRPVVGIALLVIGVVHVLVAPLLYGDALRSILDGGVFASLDENPALADLRSAGFWYVTAGIGLIALGMMVAWAERQVGTLPSALGWLLIALGLWGIVLVPLSPFWLFPVVSIFAFRAARRASV